MNRPRSARAGLNRMAAADAALGELAGGVVQGRSVPSFEGSGASSRGHGIRFALTVLATIAAMATVGPAFAEAAPRSVSGFFPLSLSSGSATGQFSGQQGVAVNVSGAGAADPGDIYVADTNNSRVQVFSAAGVFKFMVGRDVLKPGTAGNVANNERQQAAVTGATGGTFVLRDLANNSVPIAWNADAGTVDAAIEGISSIGAGNVAVSGPAGGPWAIEFVGALADTDARQLSVLGSSLALTPPGATVAVTTVEDGALAAERCSVAADCQVGLAGGQGGNLRGPQGIAVDQSDGSVYVTERNNLRVQKFTADGQFVRAWGRDVSTSDASNGAEVCTTASDCKAGVSGGSTLARGGEFSSNLVGHLAVAPAGAPNAGNVVVADGANRRVQEFGPSGGFVRAWGFDVVESGAVTSFEVCTVAADCKTGAAGSGSGQFAANTPTRVAVDSTGAIYASEPSGNFRIQKFDAGLGSATTFAGGILTGTSTADGPSEIAIGADDHVLVARQYAAGTGSPPAVVAERRVLEFDSGGALVDTHAVGAGLGSVNAEGASGVDGLAVNTATGVVYVSANTFMAPTTASASRIYTLEEGVSAPSGSLGLSWVGSHGALLVGAVNPNGPDTPLGAGVRTGYRVEISEDGVVWSPFAESDAGNGTDSVGVSKVATGLKAATAYQTRLVLTKAFNGSVTIPGPSFVTPASRPDVLALSPTDRQATSVVLNGRINPNGSATSYRFEYGPTVAYGSSVPVPDASAGSGSAAAVFSEPLGGLEPGTTYHFRVVATNATGTAVSADRTFTTSGGDPDPERTIEMVSQPDKIGGVGVGLWAAGPGHLASSGVAAYRGERFAVGGSYGAPLNGDTKHGYTNDWSFAERTGDRTGWLSHSPITHPNYQPGVAQFVEIHAVSEDLSRSYTNGGNSTTAIFPEMGADSEWPSFITGFFLDWGNPPEQPSRWELFGPANLDQVGDPGPQTNLWNMAFSADGSALVAQSKIDVSSPPRSSVYGLQGPGDPTWPAFGDLVAGRSIYLADTSGLPADTFAGTNPRTLVNVCTGEGASRTQLPAVDSGRLESTDCPAPGPGRDARLISDHGAALSQPMGNPALAGTITKDGSRVFFMSPDPIASGVPDGISASCSGSGTTTLCPPQLYVRQKNADGSVTTRWISKAEPELFGAQAASLTGTVRFEGATPDGNRVFFRTNSPLTTDDPNGLDNPPDGGIKTGTPATDSWDLYMYEFPTDPNADIADGQLTRISAGPDASGDCNSPSPRISGSNGTSIEVASGLRFASDDGRRVYFVCSAPLPDVAGVAGGSITEPGGTTDTADLTNLYLYDEHRPAGQRWAFVARLPRVTPGADFNVCASTGKSPRSPLTAESGAAGANIIADGSRDAGPNCFNGTSDGGFVTFFTMGRLTSDDPASPETGDIYAYDADSDELVRVTGVQSGVGGTYLCAPGKPASPLPATDNALCHGDGGVDQQSAVNTRQGGVVNRGLGLVSDPADPGDRVVFFESKSRLVAEDLDSGYDVYQWRNGELSLLTSGAVDSKDALYKGNDRDGRNVFFVTQDRVTWQDHDAVADIYSARVGGGIEEPVQPPVCDALGGGCQGAGAGSVSAVAVTAPPVSDGDAMSERRVLRLGVVGRRARARAARTGVLRLRVRTSRAGVVRVSARARLGRRSVRVGGARKRVAKAGTAVVGVRLSTRARRALRVGRLLSVSVRVSQAGARSRTATVRLRRGNRS